MDATKPCPKCHQPLPENAPDGLCPACLLNVGLLNPPSPSIASTTGAQRFVAPTPEELNQAFPHLEIHGLLGQGGMGAVYKAIQPSLDRVVAVKILPSEVGNDPAFTERFTREAKALAKLTHQNIVTVFDFGNLGDQYYIVMEYVDGTDLRHMIDCGAIEPEQALQIIRQICDALQYAHNQGVVHRDIKPENILVDRDGQVRIADFGLAKLLNVDSPVESLTGTRQIMGTPRYMAPEQTRGTKQVDHRADIFSLGVIFYELLTGDLPIGRFQPPSKKIALDARLDEVVLRALENEPADRYQKASDVNLDIENITKSRPVPTAPVKQSSQLQPPPTMSKKAIWGTIWFAPFIPVLIFMFIAVTIAVPSSRSGSLGFTPMWYMASLLMTLLLPIGLTSMIGTPTLGYFALKDIKQSNGRLSGGKLAVFDLLVFPLLFLDAIIITVVLSVTASFQLAVATPLLMLLLLVALLVCGFVDILIFQSVSHSVLGRPGESGKPSSIAAGDSIRLILLMFCVNVAILILIVAFAPQGSNLLWICLASVVVSIGVYFFIAPGKRSA